MRPELFNGVLFIPHMDNMTSAKRSAQMALVHSRNTKPELLVRRIVTAMGYRYRLHGRKLPGKPDLVFGPKKKVIFVNGCFWHGHKCSLGRIPKTRVLFWTNKIFMNSARDKKNIRALARRGWKPLVLWECDLKKKTKRGQMLHKIELFLK